MSGGIFLAVVIALMASQVLPRYLLHWVGFLGYGVLTWGVALMNLGWLLFSLVAFGWVVHTGMLYYILTLRRDPR